MLKAGIIGCGRIVEEGHAEAFLKLKDRVQVVAIADPAPKRLEKIGTLLGVPEGNRYTDYKDLVTSQTLDFIDLAVPHFVHKEAAVFCANHGQNLLMEKPLATDMAEAQAIADAVAKNRIHFCLLHNYLYMGNYAAALKTIEEGKIGKPFLSRCDVIMSNFWPGAQDADPTWRTQMAKSGGGALIDNGYHFIYLLEALMQSPIKRVYAKVGTFFHDINVDDTAVVLYEHENGGVSDLKVGWSAVSSRFEQEIHGTKGSLLFGSILGSESSAPPLQLCTESGCTSVDMPDWGFWGFNKLFERFVDDFEAKKSPVSMAAGLRNLRIIMAGYESSRTGRPVDVGA